MKNGAVGIADVRSILLQTYIWWYLSHMVGCSSLYSVQAIILCCPAPAEHDVVAQPSLASVPTVYYLIWCVCRLAKILAVSC